MMPNPHVSRLTPRHMEWIVAYCDLCLSVNEAARYLRISPHTSKAHLRDIYKLLNIGSRQELCKVYWTQIVPQRRASK